MINYFLGEEKYVTARICPKRPDDTLVVVEAQYRLIAQDGTVVDTGPCSVDGPVLTMLLAPNEPGVYKLEVSTVVPPERVIGYARISVIDGEK